MCFNSSRRTGIELISGWTWLNHDERYNMIQRIKPLGDAKWLPPKGLAMFGQVFDVTHPAHHLTDSHQRATAPWRQLGGWSIWKKISQISISCTFFWGGSRCSLPWAVEPGSCLWKGEKPPRTSIGGGFCTFLLDIIGHHASLAGHSAAQPLHTSYDLRPNPGIMSSKGNQPQMALFCETL